MKRFTMFCPFLLLLTQLALSFAADYDPSFRIGSIPQQQPQDDKLNGGNSMFHQNNPRPFSSNGNFGASSSSSNGNSFQLQNPSSSSSYYHPASADVNQSPAVDLNQFVPPMSGQQQQSRYPNSTAKVSRPDLNMLFITFTRLNLAQ